MAAYQSILDLNSDAGLSWIEADLTGCSANTARTFNDIDIPLSHKQRAIAAIAFINSQR